MFVYSVGFFLGSSPEVSSYSIDTGNLSVMLQLITESHVYSTCLLSSVVVVPGRVVAGTLSNILQIQIRQIGGLIPESSIGAQPIVTSAQLLAFQALKLARSFRGSVEGVVSLIKWPTEVGGVSVVQVLRALARVQRRPQTCRWSYGSEERKRVVWMQLKSANGVTRLLLSLRQNTGSPVTQFWLSALFHCC